MMIATTSNASINERARSNDFDWALWRRVAWHNFLGSITFGACPFSERSTYDYPQRIEASQLF
jgi:hypothetical protein